MVWLMNVEVGGQMVGGLGAGSVGLLGLPVRVMWILWRAPGAVSGLVVLGCVGVGRSVSVGLVFWSI